MADAPSEPALVGASGEETSAGEKESEHSPAATATGTATAGAGVHPTVVVDRCVQQSPIQSCYWRVSHSYM